jgi:NADPH2:quinone reductase
VSSKEKADLADAAGADAVINYREEDVAARVKELAPGGAQIVVEVNTENLRTDLSAVAPGGNIAIYVAGEVTIPSFKAMLKNVSLDFVLTYTTTTQEKDDAVAAVAEAVNAGAFRVGAEAGLPILRYPFERVADAHEAVEQNAVGKVVIQITEP